MVANLHYQLSGKNSIILFYPSPKQHQSSIRKLLPWFVGLKSAPLSHTDEEIFWQTVILNEGFLDQKLSNANSQ